MFLKRMELKGFKSFADHTEILFQPGINIIVGPNGCGKSNVVDAIRWVLGEANVRAIRGQRNEDIIFSGTDQNRALGMASVEITLDNSDGLLGSEFQEIAVFRKLFRSGESEYYLNRTRVRMKDIHALFTGTGVGKRGYSIVGQGELEQVLNGHPLDRRLYLEEASGISKHRQQRDEVRRRISTTNEDLLRVNDLLAELTVRKEEVFQKAQKAEAYTMMSQEYRRLEKDLLSYELNRVRNSLEQRSKDRGDLQQRFVSLQKQADDLKAELEKAADSSETRRNRVEQLKEQRFTREAELQSLQSEQRLSQERIKNARERAEASAEDQIKYQQMANSIDIDLDKVRTEFYAESGKHQEKMKAFQELNAQEGCLTDKILQSERDLEQYKTELFQAMNEEADTRNQIRDSEEKLTRLKDKYHRLMIQKEELVLQGERGREELERISRQAGEYAAKVSQGELILEKRLKDKLELEEQQQLLEQKLAELNLKRIKIENELLAIQERQKARAGFSHGVKFLMHDDQRPLFPGILGVVGEMIEVPLGLEIAIETAVGRGLENIVVNSVAEARRAVEYLKQQRAGRVTFLPLDVLRVISVEKKWMDAIASHPGALGLASRLVTSQPEYQLVIEYLLNRIVIVEDMDSGISFIRRHHYPLRVVTLEGEIFAAGGALTGGMQGSKPEGPLQRRQAEQSLLQELHKCQSTLAGLQNQADHLNQRLRDIDQDLDEIRTGLTEHRVHLQMLQQQNNEYRQQQSRFLKDQKASEDELAYMSQEIKELEKEILHLNGHREQQEKHSKEITQALEDSRFQCEDYRRELEIHRARVASYREQVEIKSRELESLQRNLNQMEQIYQSYTQSAQDAEQLHQRLEREVLLEKQRIATLETQITAGQDQLYQLTGLLQEEQQAELASQEQLQSIRAATNPIKEQLDQLQQQIHQIELMLARLETEQSVLINRWEEKYSGESDQFNQSASSAGGVRGWKQRLEELEQEMAALEPVDLTAISEYQQVKERHDFLFQQVQDLSEAQQSLESLLKETENLMMRRFLQFLNVANESFQETFKEIFNGGEAALVLENCDDRLDAGVDFEVKLPGKKVQALNLLSGGERALTCIAFIFSLLRLKPTPFCLLDEIDAALDETNLMRYTQFLKNMAGNMQFVVVTHRQATIECGNHLYGVTMPEKGISRVFTLDLSQAETLAG